MEKAKETKTTDKNKEKNTSDGRRGRRWAPEGSADWGAKRANAVAGASANDSAEHSKKNRNNDS